MPDDPYRHARVGDIQHILWWVSWDWCDLMKVHRDDKIYVQILPDWYCKNFLICYMQDAAAA